MGYRPASRFLGMLVEDDIALTGDAFADANLGRLLDLLRDSVEADRDRAAFLLSEHPIDTPRLRDALLRAATRDPAPIVRAEPVRGLAMRDADLALPLVRKALRADGVWLPMFEAAAFCAHPSLVAHLRRWAEPGDEPGPDAAAAAALLACQSGVPPRSWRRGRRPPRPSKKKAERELGRVQQGGEKAEAPHVVHPGTAHVTK